MSSVCVHIYVRIISHQASIFTYTYMCVRNKGWFFAVYGSSSNDDKNDQDEQNLQWNWADDDTDMLFTNLNPTEIFYSLLL